MEDAPKQPSSDKTYYREEGRMLLGLQRQVFHSWQRHREVRKQADSHLMYLLLT